MGKAHLQQEIPFSRQDRQDVQDTKKILLILSKKSRRLPNSGIPENRKHLGFVI